jgi:hypothetical protein
MSKNLLLWIVTPSDLDKCIDTIKDIWKPEEQLYILKRKNEIIPTEFFVVWNTNWFFRYRGVIKINRKGSTYFTIDAMNALSLQATGRIDKSFVPDWEKYRYRLLLTNNDGSINEIHTETYEIVKI